MSRDRLACSRGEPGATPQCFISYSWGVWQHERWVVRLATDLRNSGIGVVLDQWDNAEPGSSIARFISLIASCNFIVVVGTPEYKLKYDNQVSPAGSIVAAEFDLISDRLMGTESDKRSVVPLLLAGEVETSFPPLLHRRKAVDVRRDEQYVLCLADLVIKMLGLSFSDPVIIDLRDSLQGEIPRAGALPVA